MLDFLLISLKIMGKFMGLELRNEVSMEDRERKVDDNEKGKKEMMVVMRC